MKNLTAEELQEKVDLFWQAVDAMPSDRSLKVKEMMRGPVGDSYFLAPASHREDFHECYPGGLLVHSLHVASNLRRLVRATAPNRYPTHVLDFVSLFHDLGKAGDGEHELYVLKDSQWHIKQGILYDFSPDIRYMTSSDRTLWLMQRHGIELSQEEFLALKLADGQYVSENAPYRMKEPQLATLLHTADLFATQEEKRAFRETGA